MKKSVFTLPVLFFLLSACSSEFQPEDLKDPADEEEDILIEEVEKSAEQLPEGVEALSMITPTVGQITQGFHEGHFGYDFANVEMPDVIAAASGTVAEASVGTWGGGYGSYVIIEHENGFETLYAHLGDVIVSEVDLLLQGDKIGTMGNTGRTYGTTGITLHFEVVHEGIKYSPSHFLSDL